MSDLPPDPRSIYVPTLVPGDAPSGEPSSDQTVESRQRRRWLWVLVAIMSVLALAVGASAVVAAKVWGDVERVDLGVSMRGARTGTNYLIVGTDSRAGVDPGVQNADVLFGADVVGERTDTIAVLRVDGGAVSLLAIPRDLYVPIAGGAPSRINAAFAIGGPADLVNTVQRELGIGIDHYLEVDLAGFLGLVDALGGVTIDFSHPAYDDRSGLVIEVAGPRRLTGSDALAYVRSRRYTEVVDGVAVTDPTSDLGRVQRQQRFLLAVMDQLGTTKNPITLFDALRAVAANVTVDGGIGMVDAASLGLTLRGADPVTATVPTARHITAAGADVLILTPQSDAVLAEFRG